VNTTFRIAFGNYELSLDRKALTYSLTETVTRTSWAKELSVGWIELKDRETQQIARYAFGDCKVISVSEKMSGTGKRILLGLDTPEGIPIDIYFTCAEKEIQLTVEASRDSKTHELHRICLLPDLCGDVTNYVLPMGEGALVFPENLPTSSMQLPVWQHTGLSMPFIGGIKSNSALCLITDSAYASAQLSQYSCDWVYARDPERRRLEIRLIFIPNGDYISIARVYRDKLVSERAHITLRKKMREKPELQNLLSSIGALYSNTEKVLRESNILPCALIPDNALNLPEFQSENYWTEMEEVFERDIFQEKAILFSRNQNDWLNSKIDVLIHKSNGNPSDIKEIIPVPLHNVVYHDSVLIGFKIDKCSLMYLKCILNSGFPIAYFFEKEMIVASCYEWGPRAKRLTYRMQKIMSLINHVNFTSFAIAHRFLNNEFYVQEIEYSNKMKIVVNFNTEEEYSHESYSLPPLGFLVTHPELIAHDALRIGEETFATRAWRVRRGEETEWTVLG
jgi:hypothetical protein